MRKEAAVVPIPLVEEMKRSYIDYAMSVIVSRALPDVRDGLKPVQRRILYAMSELGFGPDRPHKKSARVVGEVLARYHPHSDTAVYDAMVRLAQDFASRYLLVDGHGNFGSVDGDPPAAIRYTESRLAPLAMEMLRDIDRATVDFTPNYDETTEEPVVLPARIPNLLANGVSGIAVGMATNIPPHNLGELIDGLFLLQDNPDASLADLLRVIPGPDFPTGALILGHSGIAEAYATGRGLIRMRAVAQAEVGRGGRQRIVVTELPYQVNKARLVERIADLVRERKIDGITDLRDESDRSGIRIVIELRRDAAAQVILNRLYRFTQMEDSFGVILLALVDGTPQIMDLRTALRHYLDYQAEVIVRRTRFDLERAEQRAHIVEGLRLALDHIDRVVAMIRASRTVDEAREGLTAAFGLTEKQAQAILDMRLQRLTGLEREKLDGEYRGLLKDIAYHRKVLGDERLVRKIIRRELAEIRERFTDPRRTRIIDQVDQVDPEDLIAEEDVVITLTHFGYVKRLPLATYHAQRRGGRGVTAAGTREDDFLEHLFVTTTHHHLFFFTSRGHVHRLKVHELPEAGRQARGTAIVNLIRIESGESVQAVIPVRDFTGKYLMMVTRQGIVKKTPLSEFENVRAGGLIALNLAPGDDLIGVRLTAGDQEVLLVTRNGMVIRFRETEVRPMGRQARGVKGIALDPGDGVVAMDVDRAEGALLLVTARGFGKRVSLKGFRTQGRRGRGLIGIKLTPERGPVAGAMVVRPDDEVMAVSAEGTLIRLKVADIPTQGRLTRGVTLMRLPGEHTVGALARVVDPREAESPAGGEQGTLF
ncbi:MAG: DNA gyrase subunit A [bacterium]|nr:DNA gyrase subunit A [bacterium]